MAAQDAPNRPAAEFGASAFVAFLQARFAPHVRINARLEVAPSPCISGWFEHRGTGRARIFRIPLATLNSSQDVLVAFARLERELAALMPGADSDHDDHGERARTRAG